LHFLFEKGLEIDLVHSTSPFRQSPAKRIFRLGINGCPARGIRCIRVLRAARYPARTIS
jgi:hypothetical protein